MRSPYDYDLCVIGGGSGGCRAAQVAAKHGARVGIAEAAHFGGTCVHRGCVPKKLLVHASRFGAMFAEAGDYGWHPDSARFDWPALIAAKDRRIAELEGHYRKGLIEAGVTLHEDRVAFADAHTLRLERSGATLRADKILIATGSQPQRAPDLPGSELAITSDELFALERLPPRVVVAGGGYIALESASMLAGFGVEVTLLCRDAEILPGFDAEAAAHLRSLLERRLSIRLECRLDRIERLGKHLVARTREGSSFDCEAVLLAIGRKPNVGDLGLERLGVNLGKEGEIAVDAQSRSSVENLFAVGDVTDRMNLTPIAIREGQAFADTQFGGKPATVDYREVPTAIFTTPEFGRVGLTEREARERFGADAVECDLRRFVPLTASLGGSPEKFLFKRVVRQEDDRVLGVHVVGPGAAEMVQLLAIPLKMGATRADFEATVALHPTAAEELVTLRRLPRA